MMIRDRAENVYNTFRVSIKIAYNIIKKYNSGTRPYTVYRVQNDRGILLLCVLRIYISILHHTGYRCRLWVVGCI